MKERLVIILIVLLLISFPAY
ncbi:type I toxin-antitoxin system Ibs family toxin [Escherichia coli]|nr:type I toxin-antitoxin system Ibs family toxin [Escherichia coli]